MEALTTTYEVFYNGKNITGNISPYLIYFKYTDKAHGESDELEILMEDSDLLWQNEWYPSKGDKITASIYSSGRKLDCGTFTIDEIESSGGISGDTISIKGLATGINKSIRTKTSYAHENKTLREIANTVASKHGLTVDGKIADIRIARITQYQETDLFFLQRLANEYGYTFSIRDGKMTFTDVFEIENKNVVVQIARQDINSYSIKDKTSASYKSAKTSFHNPKNKQVVSYEHKESQQAYSGAKPDVLEIRTKAENRQQAEIKSKVALYRANSLQQEGGISMPGNVLILAGNNIELIGIGMLSGKYYLSSTTHNVDRSGGYVTDAEIKRVGLVAAAKQKL